MVYGICLDYRVHPESSVSCQTYMSLEEHERRLCYCHVVPPVEVWNSQRWWFYLFLLLSASVKPASFHFILDTANWSVVYPVRGLVRTCRFKQRRSSSSMWFGYLRLIKTVAIFLIRIVDFVTLTSIRLNQLLYSQFSFFEPIASKDLLLCGMESNTWLYFSDLQIRDGDTSFRTTCTASQCGGSLVSSACFHSLSIAIY